MSSSDCFDTRAHHITIDGSAHNTIHTAILLQYHALFPKRFGLELRIMLAVSNFSIRSFFHNARILASTKNYNSFSTSAVLDFQLSCLNYRPE